MPRLFTLTQYTPVRRKLRRQSTQAEVALWNFLQSRRFHGYKFRRQHSIGRYIVDFFCTELLLAIEVDGVTHLEPERIRHDQIRQHWLEDHGVRVIRFTDNEILSDPELVLQQLKQYIDSSHPSSPRRA